MSGAREELAAFAPSLSPQDPTVPLIPNAGGEVISSGTRYLELIVNQVASPVDWEACMATLRDRGVTAMIEVAPAGTLTGLAKRELKGIALTNLHTPDDLDAARTLVREHAGATAAHEAQEN